MNSSSGFFSPVLKISLAFSICLVSIFSSCNTQIEAYANEEEVSIAKKEALSTLESFPSQEQIDTCRSLSQNGKEIFSRLRFLLVKSSKFGNKVLKSEIENTNQEFAWAAKTTIIFLRNNGGGPDRTNCNRNCEAEYDRCYARNGCKFGVGTCSCDREFMSCVGGCIIKTGFSGVILY